MKLSFFTLLCFLSFSVFAQKSKNEKDGYKITGRLTDSLTKHPLEYATISIFPEGVKKPVNGTISDIKGRFSVNIAAAGTYKLVAEFIGYKPHTLYSITINKEHPLIEIKDISLEPKATTMQAITISGQPKVMETKIDKLVFNAERDLTSQVGVATDILKKIPQVSVDVDGNVQLAGSSSVRFLINGKPSAAFGSDIAEVLQAIPASQIKSVEVITTPGAKYDAQGLGGIINIILKKNNSRGINGNLSLTGGTRTENGSFNFNARKGKFGMNAYISGNARLKAQSLSSSDRLTNDTSANTTVLLQQASSGNDQRSGYQTGLGFDYDINDHNGITGALSFNNFGHKSSGLNNQLQNTKDINGAILSDIESSINSDHTFNFHSVDASLDYKKTFKKDGQELDLSVNTSSGHRSVIDNNYQYAMPKDSLFYSTKGKNPGTEKETQIRLDYTQPLKKDFLLGVGSKLSFNDIAGNSDVSKLNGLGGYIKDNYLSNILDYHQKVYALYAEMTFPVFNWFNAKIGERYERTEINSYFSDAQNQAKIPGYNTFVPSIFFSKKLTEYSQLKLSYTKRIQRPNYRDLNPFINTSDPKNLSTGNPNLTPEIGRRYELGYSVDIDKVGFFMVNLFYRVNDHDIQPYIVYYPSLQVGDTTYTDVALSTNQNIGRENNYGLNFFTSAKFFSKLDMRTNLFFYERHTINTIDKGYNYNSFNYYFNLNADYQFSNTLVAEFFGNFSSARHEAQGTYPSFTSYSFAIRKQFWNKKGSLALTASNPFHKNLVMKTKVFGSGFTMDQTRTIPFRSIGINFTWKFGKLEFKKDKGKPDDNLNPPVDNG
ncbi:MAG: TonB-dependent receptor [Bacteroidota bacterium]|nr:TonB-dependent receptor [Bacteroidota bacterium]